VAAAFVQGTGIESVGSVASLSKAFASNVTAGNLLLVGGVAANDKLVATSCADSIGGSYTRDSNSFVSSTSTQVSIFSTPNTGGGSNTVTLTPSASTFMSIGIAELSGMVTASPLDAQNTKSASGSANTIVTSNLVTDQNTAIVGIVSHSSATTTITPDGTYTDIFVDTNSASMPIDWCYKIVGAGTYTGSWTFGTTVANRAAAAAAYKEGTAGAAVQAQMTMLGCGP
jgi:hypothetical protein